MTILSQNERISLFIVSFLAVFILLAGIFFSLENIKARVLFVGGTTIIISIILVYSFLIQPIKPQSRRFKRYPTYSGHQYHDFSPKIIPPPQRSKKMILKSECRFCGKSALMGFTCSYCNEYFCSDHRLPEKHNCIGIKSR